VASHFLVQHPAEIGGLVVGLAKGVEDERIARLEQPGSQGGPLALRRVMPDHPKARKLRLQRSGMLRSAVAAAVIDQQELVSSATTTTAVVQPASPAGHDGIDVSDCLPGQKNDAEGLITNPR
jgi:hypothetical protein